MTFEKTFDLVARVITSLGAIIIILFLVVTGMVFASHTLFTEVFPSGMTAWERIGATWVTALGWEATVLITTVNVKHLKRFVPLLMALCSGVIVLFFIEAFDNTQAPLIIVQRWFVGLLVATINYIYAELFHRKWTERLELIERPSRLNEIESRFIESQSKVNELSFKLNDVQPQLNELADLRKWKAKNDKDLTCPHCKVIQDSYGTLHAHKGHCDKNPKNKKPNDTH